MNKLVITTLIMSLLTLSTTVKATGHYEARNCEIFIDKVATSYGSHASHNMTFYVKTLNERLDGKIVEVGFRNRNETRISGEGVKVSNWYNHTLDRFPSSSNYWKTSIHISDDYTHVIYEGAFYVTTDKGTTYWARANHTNNFIFDDNAFSNVAYRSTYNYSGEIRYAVPTQNQFGGYYNSDNCY